MSHIPERIEYGDRPFRRAQLPGDPLSLFQEWFGEAVASGVHEANGLCLCTQDPDEGPDGRIVLLKGYDAAGFSFFTNFESNKGHQLARDPRACLVFWWQALRRQVRVRGNVEKLGGEACDAYFDSRPRETQLGAWASQQSRPIGSRAELDQRHREAADRYPEEVPRPPYWGGYLLVPRRIEFWQGRDSRLHDRFVYSRVEEGWDVLRLMP